ncbi:MAG: hypothetical protein ACODAC_09455 [Pseudomonadota bacterium]
MQKRMSSPDPAETDLDALKAELAKWRERVPKLAAALRQRATEVEGLRTEIERLRGEEDPLAAVAHVRAREARIGQLETELEEARDHHHRLAQENEELRERNDQMLETAQIAERQIASLTGFLETLRADAERHKAHLHALDRELAECRTERQAALAEKETKIGELRERIRELEAQLAERPVADEDLTRIHGVGSKLATQLEDLGYRRLQQIAGLDLTALEDPGHPLHAHRARIVRDRWIEQARRLTGA